MDRKRASTNTKYAGVTIRHSTKSSAIQVRFTYKGVTCREVLSIQPTEANQRYASRLLAEIHNKIERGTFSYVEYFPNSKKAKLFGYAVSSVSLEVLFNEYLTESEKLLEHSTFVNYRKIINKYLIPKFGKILVRDFYPKHIRKFIEELEVKPKTIRNILIPLRNVIENALNDDYIKSNPFERVAITKLLNKKNKSFTKEITDPFNREEINALIEHACPALKLQLQFWFFTGLRTSEFFALLWDDIDWIKNKAFIWKATVYGKSKDRTKTKSGTREVMLLPPAIEALKKQKEITFLAGKHIFMNPKTNEPYLRDKQFREWIWRPLLKRAGVRYRHPYTIRHTFASMMLSNGENIMWVAKQMGHSTVATVIDTYGKWIPDGSVSTGYQTKTEWDNFLESAQLRHNKNAAK